MNLSANIHTKFRCHFIFVVRHDPQYNAVKILNAAPANTWFYMKDNGVVVEVGDPIAHCFQTVCDLVFPTDIGHNCRLNVHLFKESVTIFTDSVH